MPLSAFLLAFAAAWLHGTGNVLLGRTKEPEAATAVMLVLGVVAFAPVAVLDWHVDSAAIPYIVASAVLELCYFAFLAAAYRRSDVSLVYPVARGSAPVLVLLGTLLVLHEGANVGEILGVIAVGAGILLVRGPRVGGDRIGLVMALATGVFIAGYTLVDKQGLEHASPIPYIELVLIGPSLVYLAAIARLRGRAAIRAETTPQIALIGSVVIATGLAAVILREHVTRGRYAGAALVATGVALLALS